MFLFLKKKHEEEEKPDIAGSAHKSVELSDFIPYYCHYNASTLLTKNGELLKIIRIDSNKSGLNYESGDGTENTVRNTIRRAIGSSITSENFALWIHTLRRRNPISHEGRFKEPLATYVYENWQKKNSWKHQFHNEIYITIMHDGQRAHLFDQHSMQNVFSPRRNRAYRHAFLEKSCAELELTANNVLAKIREHYNARYLAVTERAHDQAQAQQRSGFYSEIMEFLGTLINLRSESFPVNESQMDKALPTHQITFGYNALESRNAQGEKRFAGILTLKQYNEAAPETVDRILQSPLELVVSQSFHFIPPNVALKQYREQKTLFDMSEDAYSIKQSGLEAKLKANRKRPVDYGRHQMNITILTDDYKQLDTEISKAQQIFAESGFIVVREDLKLEEAYWSQLPGNFEFIRRQDVIISPEVAGFTRLNLFPNGVSQNNHWGDALALIPTVVNSPYFFNFHYQDNGHTLLLDYNSFNDHTSLILLNFLLTSSFKFNPRVYVFDYKQSSRLFFDKLGGSYHIYDTNHHTPGNRLNPFQLEANSLNQSFLLAWCLTLVEPYVQVNPPHKEILQAALAQMMHEPPQQRSLVKLVEKLHMGGHNDLVQALAHYHGRGHHAGLFDATHETLNFTAPLNAFDMGQMGKSAQCTVALFSYLMHRIINALDGTPTVIVLHNAWALLENNFFAPRLESLLEMLRQNNVMVIFTARNPQDLVNTNTLTTLMKSCATRLYIPDDISIDYAAQPALGLSKHDSSMLRRMDRQKGDFLIKQNKESVGLRVNLDQMDDIRAIFAGDIKNLIAAGGRFASLPQFY